MIQLQVLILALSLALSSESLHRPLTVSFSQDLVQAMCQVGLLFVAHVRMFVHLSLIQKFFGAAFPAHPGTEQTNFHSLFCEYSFVFTPI
jgi:hypothetical protein